MIFFYFSAKTYVVGPQKSRLKETVLLSTQTYVLIDLYENNYKSTLKFFT